MTICFFRRRAKSAGVASTPAHSPRLEPSIFRDAVLTAKDRAEIEWTIGRVVDHLDIILKHLDASTSRLSNDGAGDAAGVIRALTVQISAARYSTELRCARAGLVPTFANPIAGSPLDLPMDGNVHPFEPRYV